MPRQGPQLRTTLRLSLILFLPQTGQPETGSVRAMDKKPTNQLESSEQYIPKRIVRRFALNVEQIQLGDARPQRVWKIEDPPLPSPLLPRREEREGESQRTLFCGP